MTSKAVSIWLPQVIIESVLIVVSILVALGLDSWRQNREDEEFVRTALSNFEIEVRQNKARIDDAAPFNKGLRVVLSQHYGVGDIDTVDEFVKMVEIYSPAALQSTAWDTALATGSLAKMEYGLVTALSLTYSLQERYDRSTRAGMSDLISPQFLSEDTLKLAIYNSIRFLDDVTGMEVELEVTYGEAARVIQSALRQLDVAGGDDADDEALVKDVAHP
jgi:hypothetical protein